MGNELISELYFVKNVYLRHFSVNFNIVEQITILTSTISGLICPLKKRMQPSNFLYK